MVFNSPLIHGTLIRRYKRFLADVELENGEIVVAHCTNSGSMKTCIEEGAEVFLTPVNDPKRKTKYTWEMIKINGNWIGVNTGWPNVLVYEAVKNNQIKNISGYTEVKREVKFGDSRFDVYCKNDQEECFIEVKNVTMKEGDMGLFPDAVTTRGQKHLKTLIEAKQNGYRAIMFYVIQRADVDVFGLAKQIDPDYANALERAIENGVEVFAMQALVTPQSIVLNRYLPIHI